MILISVTWLGPANGPRYHGVEWPPAPLRVFQAMVASAGRSDQAGKQRGFEALGRLETAPPPTIYAPEPRWAVPVASAVPNNDADVVWRERARGRLREARLVEAKSKTIRRRHGRMIDGPVHYVWDARVSPEDVAVLSALADGVTHVGHGIDLAAVTVRSGSPATAGTAHRPDRRAGNLLQVPYPGVLQLLEERHRHERGRIATDDTGLAVADAKRVAHVEHGYVSDAAILKTRYRTYRLVVGQRLWLEPPARALAVAAMVRHAVGEAAKDAGLDKEDMAEVMGHGGPGRIHAIPLPNVGHRWADAGIRRVMVASSPDLREDLWSQVVRRLPGRELKPDEVGDGEGRTRESAAEWTVLLEPGEDSVSGQYTACSSIWTTATPVVLPGLDHRRGKPRPARATRRLLRFAGIPEQAIATVTYDSMGSIPGTEHARSARVPAHLAKYPRTHATVEFTAPVEGPLFLGAGIGWGLGLLAACER